MRSRCDRRCDALPKCVAPDQVRQRQRRLKLVIVVIGLLVMAGMRADRSASARTGPGSNPASVLDTPALPRDFTLPTPLFTPDSAWNQTVTGASVLPTNGE